jgi:hypothetical protein
MLALDIAYTIYMKFGDLASALRIALHLEKVSAKVPHAIPLHLATKSILTHV